MNGDALQTWKHLAQARPDPSGEHFACGVFEAWYFVQVVMIQLCFEGRPGIVEIRKIDIPASLWVHGAFHRQLDLEAMAVEAATLMALRDVRQPVCCFKAELMHEANVHGPGLYRISSETGPRKSVMTRPCRNDLLFEPSRSDVPPSALRLGVSSKASKPKRRRPRPRRPPRARPSFSLAFAQG